MQVENTPSFTGLTISRSSRRELGLKNKPYKHLQNAVAERTTEDIYIRKPIGKINDGLKNNPDIVPVSYSMSKADNPKEVTALARQSFITKGTNLWNFIQANILVLKNIQPLGK